MADFLSCTDLSLQVGESAAPGSAPTKVLAIGEVLWDVFGESKRLGGAPLNFAAHAKRLGLDPLLVSGAGTDLLGSCAIRKIANLGLDTAFVQRSGLKTGTAEVHVGPGDRTRFVIARPAAYDSVSISDHVLEQLREWSPHWLYYGTLFASVPEGKAALWRLLEGLPSCLRFYDLNLRPGFDSADLVAELLKHANVVKLNEDELEAVHSVTGLPRDQEAFCREGSKRFGWTAVCVTLGSRGCAMLCGSDYIQARGCTVDVADPVGAGDAFAAAFLHGIVSQRPVDEIARFANRVGALVASRAGAIPDWTMQEAVVPGRMIR